MQLTQDQCSELHFITDMKHIIPAPDSASRFRAKTLLVVLTKYDTTQFQSEVSNLPRRVSVPTILYYIWWQKAAPDSVFWHGWYALAQ